MKLYYSPHACSLAVHIALNEIGAEFQLERVNLRTKQLASGGDYFRINPNGYVPALELDDGEILFEAPAVLQYVADLNPQAGLAPPAGSLQRVRLQQLLNFAASELHKAFSPFFSATPLQGEAREAALAKVHARMNYIESLLADGRPYLLGESFTVADMYTFVVATWTQLTGIGLEPWPNIAAYIARIKARPQVEKAMRTEGLVKAATVAAD